jgi:2-C-methyl-D-erythritol 2,4-cyclodiphosphate synthase
MRVGIGYDVHGFGPGDHVTLGGEKIPWSQGIRAHSDGDVLLHALCDALLGAMALGDIGQHFPDTDPRWKDADSRLFLRHCAKLMQERHWRLVNADLTLIAEAPRVGPHRAAMQAHIAHDLRCEKDRVNIKATTSEGLGAFGRGEGLAAQAIVLLAHANGGSNGH